MRFEVTIQTSGAVAITLGPGRRRQHGYSLVPSPGRQPRAKQMSVGEGVCKLDALISAPQSGRVVNGKCLSRNQREKNHGWKR